MRLESTRSLERLAVAEAIDQSWLCRAARALEDLDQSLTERQPEVGGPTGELVTAMRRNPRLARAVSRASADRLRLHEQARSLRRRLVLVTKDARLGPELKAELTRLTCDSSAYFRRVRRLMWESFASSASTRDATTTGGPGVVA